MSTRIKVKLILMDGEFHHSGDFCWCGSHYEEKGNIFLHLLKSEIGRTQINSTEATQ